MFCPYHQQCSICDLTISKVKASKSALSSNSEELKKTKTNLCKDPRLTFEILNEVLQSIVAVWLVAGTVTLVESIY